MRSVCDYVQLIDEDKLGLNPIKQIILHKKINVVMMTGEVSVRVFISVSDLQL